MHDSHNANRHLFPTFLLTGFNFLSMLNPTQAALIHKHHTN